MRNYNPFEVYKSRYNAFIGIQDEEYGQEQTDSNDSISSQSVARNSFLINMKVLKMAILLGILILLSRLTYLQIIQGNYYQTIAEKNRIRTFSVKPQRGIIFDRNNKKLVENIPNYLLEIVPIDLPKTDEKKNEIIHFISEVTHKDESEILSKFQKINKKSYEPFIIDDTINYEQAIQIKLKSYSMPGLMLDIESKRNYLVKDALSLSHVLGYLGRISEDDIKNKKGYDLTDSIGKIGIEYEYEDMVKGIKGKQQIEVDAMGKEKKKIADEDPVAGSNLILTIDSEIQTQLEGFLQKSLNKLKKQKGVAIALDPRNGEILALVSLPGFDNNIFTKGIDPGELKKILDNESRPLFNRAIYGTYPPGSTVKLVVAAAALQEGVVTKWTQIKSVGGIKINQWYFPDWKSGGHGLTSITKALAESVNTYFYYVGGGYEQFEGLGLNRLLNYYHLSGIGSQSGIDLPGESEGLIPSAEWKEENKNEKWYIGDTYHISIGQGDLLVTPLQVANWTSMVSNGGILYQPHMLKSVEYADKAPKNMDPVILQKNIFLKEHLDIVKQGLRDAVTYGSARSLNDLPITIAGKTGTAEWSSKSLPHAWFTSFAPYPDPEIVLTILIEEGGEGSTAAVPVAKEFYLWWAQYRHFVDK